MTFACPKCGHHLDADDDMGGMETTCPACGQSLTVPSIIQPPPVTESVLTIHAAAVTGDLAAVQRLLRDGVSVDNPDDLGRSALKCAVLKGRREIAAFLLSNGADANHVVHSIVRTQNSDTILGTALGCYATMNLQERLSMVRLLLLAGANPNPEFGNESLLMDSICEYSKNGEEYFPLVELLVSHHADVNFKNSYGLTALHYASGYFNFGEERCYLKVVELLITHGANVNAAITHDCAGCPPGTTPLHFAAIRGYADIADKLLSNGADVNAKNTKLQTPLGLTTDGGGLLGIWSVYGADETVAPLLRQHGGSE